jgi:hypothetical protein
MSERVRKILKDPNHICWFAELFSGLSRDEVGQIWDRVQDRELVDLAHEQRQQPTRRNLPPIVQKKGFVYLAKTARSNLVKIGFTKQPKEREKAFRSIDPSLSLFCVTAADWKYEQALHKRFASQRRYGEWFQLSARDVALLMEEMETNAP